MSDPPKKCTNVTDQMIEHMTADLQSADGQYIQLGFTPPATPNDSHNWADYPPNHPQQSGHHYSPQFNNRVPPSMNYAPMEQPQNNFARHSPSYNNFVSQQNTTMYLSDMQNNVMYDKQLGKPINHLEQQRPDLIPLMDMRRGSYILYNQNNPQFVQSNQDINLCGYIYQDNREFNLFMTQEMQNLQQNQLLLQQQNQLPTNIQEQNSMYIDNNALMQHQQDQLVLQQAMQQQKSNQISDQQNMVNMQNVHSHATATQSRTPLIENLVGNWVPNTSGTYSPFGNSQTSALFETKQDILSNVSIQNMEQENNITQPHSKPRTTRETTNFDVDLTNIKNVSRANIKKPRMVAEVKPMRPSYSDVLAKSAPQNPSKTAKIEVKDTKKIQVKKNAKTPVKSTTPTTTRQYSVGSDDMKDNNNEKNLSVSPQHKDKPLLEQNNTTNHLLSNNWSTLDNVFNDETPFDTSDADTDKTEKVTLKKNEATRHAKKTEEPVFSTKNVPNTGDHKSNTAASAANNRQTANNNTSFEWRAENSDTNNKNTEKATGKNPKKAKETKVPTNRTSDRTSYGVLDKPSIIGKRGHRNRKRETPGTIGVLHRSFKQYFQRWSKFALYFIIWLLHLISDVFSLSIHLSKDLCTTFWSSLRTYTSTVCKTMATLVMKVKLFAKIVKFIDDTFGNSRWAFWNRGKQQEKRDRNSKANSATGPEGKSWLAAGLENNITMPSTGEEAMKRLLACKGKDPYSILGVTPDCTDDDIKRYYKKQAFLVHPDKNAQPGAEEAFKILVHAFDIIGEPERRQSYDRKVAESHQVEQAWSELNDLLSQLHQKMEYAANTIRCTNCTKRHRRVHVDRPCYAARMCAQCKIHHSAREGDIWAESTIFGFLWHYYACMDGAVYDITDWASCQRANLRHLRPNTHQVQYRIVLGKQAGGANGSSSASGSHRQRGYGGRAYDGSGDREPDLEEFLNNLYHQSGTSPQGSTAPSGESNGRPETARNRKKNKRKK